MFLTGVITNLSQRFVRRSFRRPAPVTFNLSQFISPLLWKLDLRITSNCQLIFYWLPHNEKGATRVGRPLIHIRVNY